jgi:molybdopterin converting factor small subunit
MRIRCQFFAEVELIAGTTRHEVTLPDGATVADLLEVLSLELKPGFLAELKKFEGEGLQIVVRDRPSGLPDGALTVLRDGDVVTFLVPLIGG